MNDGLPYVHGTPLHVIIGDGWARAFHVSQTVRECSEMGFFLKEEDVLAFWRLWDQNYEDYCKIAELEREIRFLKGIPEEDEADIPDDFFTQHPNPQA